MLLNDLPKEINQLKIDMKKWEQQRIGKNWYRSYFEKDLTMNELTNNLNNKAVKISSLIIKQKGNIDKLKAELDKQRPKLKLALQKKLVQLKIIQDEIDRFLPSSMKGLIKVNVLIQIFPVLIIIGIYYVLF